ncbi:MAG: MBL fold metallo-hydrolase [bacterium]|nr:MBL fold metallo-hydrolase [bacterium]
MKLTFFGAVENVTGSCYLIEADNKKILIDCGMFQGGKEHKIKNFEPFDFNPAEIDFLVLTHAHIDHAGLIPKLVKNGFQNRIITTEATTALSSIMLPDSAHIQEAETEWDNKKMRRKGEKPREPLYTMDDALTSLKYFEGFKYETDIELTPNIRIRFLDAGHILGSAITEFYITEGLNTIKITFTGDLGNSNIPILRDPTFIQETDYLITESTYGNRFHEDYTRHEELLNKMINENLNNGGKIIIPSFAVGRTQTILYHLNNLFNAKKISRITVYLDSPLAIKATKIYSQFKDLFDKEAKKILEKDKDPFDFPGLKISQSVEDSMAINDDESPAIIISASGMCSAGRIKHHLKHHIWQPNTTVLFVGYQAEGTLGRAILEKNKYVKIFNERINLRANVESISSFSAHADKKQLLEWIGNIKKKPENIFVVHGEAEASRELAQAINSELKFSAEIPKIDTVYELGKKEHKTFYVPKPVIQNVTDDDIIKLEEELIEMTESIKQKITQIFNSTQQWTKRQEMEDALRGMNIITDDVLESIQDITEYIFGEIIHRYMNMISEKNIKDDDLMFRISQLPRKQPLDFQFLMNDLRSHINETFKISKKVFK